MPVNGVVSTFSQKPRRSFVDREILDKERRWTPTTMISGLFNSFSVTVVDDETKERRRKTRLSPVHKLNQDVVEALTIMASKLSEQDTAAVVMEQNPDDCPHDGTSRGSSNSNEDERPDETEACYYESDDFSVLESQLIVNDATAATASTNLIDTTAAPPPLQEDSKVEQQQQPPPPSSSLHWSARTSFTADSPYFDAFLDSEMDSLGTLSETLNGIAARTRTFVKQGAVMSEATRRLGLACKLRSSDYEYGSGTTADYSSDNNEAAAATANINNSSEDGMATEEELTQRRRRAVGEEMAGILELLGEVRLYFARGKGGPAKVFWRSRGCVYEALHVSGDRAWVLLVA